MDSLLQQINESAEKVLAEDEIISKNIDLVVEKKEVDLEELNEAITNILATAARKIEGGAVADEDKDNLAAVLGAVAALSNPDIADAFDTRGNLGEILRNADVDMNDPKAKSAVNQLMAIGNHPSSRGYKQQALDMVNDPTKITQWTQKIRMPVERVMNQKVAMAKQQAQKAMQQDKAQNMARPMQGAVPQRSA